MVTLQKTDCAYCTTNRNPNYAIAITVQFVWSYSFIAKQQHQKTLYNNENDISIATLFSLRSSDKLLTSPKTFPPKIDGLEYAHQVWFFLVIL